MYDPVGNDFVLKLCSQYLAQSLSVSLFFFFFSVPPKERNRLNIISCTHQCFFWVSLYTQAGLKETFGVCLFDEVILIFTSSL